MAVIPGGTQFVGVNSDVDMSEKKSSQVNSTTQIYTLQDFEDSLSPDLTPITVDGNSVSIAKDPTATTQDTAVIQSSDTNAGIAIVPNGNGAITASIPDGTATGGGARGNGAVDLQTSRNTSTQIASGSSSFIGNGNENSATNDYSFVGNGSRNSNGGRYAFIGGGNSNSVTGSYQSIVGGVGNQITSIFSTSSSIGGGNSNIINAGAGQISCVISGGQSNTVSNSHATVVGGNGNTSSGQYSISGGYDNDSTGYASVAFGEDNEATAADTTVAGGWFNRATDAKATVGGGYDNLASGEDSTISGGNSNNASVIGATVVGGGGNTSSGQYSVSGGQSNTASGNHSVALGRNNIVSGSRSFAAGTNNNASNNSVALVRGMTASGLYSFAAGDSGSASGAYSVALGFVPNASATKSIALGRTVTEYYGEFSTGVDHPTFDPKFSIIQLSKKVDLTSGQTISLAVDGNSSTTLAITGNNIYNFNIEFVSIISSTSGTVTGVAQYETMTQSLKFSTKRIGGGLVNSSSLNIIDTNGDTSITSTASMSIIDVASTGIQVQFTAPTFTGGGTINMNLCATLQFTKISTS